MKLLKLLLPEIFELSPYRLAEGEEEYRVKREILSNIRKGCSAALELKGERGLPGNREWE